MTHGKYAVHSHSHTIDKENVNKCRYKIHDGKYGPNKCKMYSDIERVLLVWLLQTYADDREMEKWTSLLSPVFFS